MAVAGKANSLLNSDCVILVATSLTASALPDSTPGSSIALGWTTVNAPMSKSSCLSYVSLHRSLVNAVKRAPVVACQAASVPNNLALPLQIALT